MTLQCWMNGEFIPLESAALKISDLNILRGYGIFDFFRTVNGRPLFLQDYLDRFYRSAEGLHLDVPIDRETLQSVIHQLLAINRIPESGVRLQLTGGHSPEGYKPGKPNFFIIQQPVTVATAEQFERGYRLITHEHFRELPEIKSINYLTGIWMQPQLRQLQADDVLFHFGGKVSECPRNNIFVVGRDKRIVTPSHGVLHGITRTHVLTLRVDGHSMREGHVTLGDLFDADEAFITSTTKRILPVVLVDGKTIGTGTPGSVTRELYRQFLQMEKAETAS